MPFVRIDIPQSTCAEHATALGEGVHRALVETFDVPADDRFQVIARRAPDELICTPQYMGVRHSAHVAMVQITCSPGRSLDKKRALYERIVRNAQKDAGFEACDVIVHLVETVRENWSFGHGIAHYAPPSAF